MSRNILAISGSGFSYGTPSFIDEYILKQKSGIAPLKVCFIPTATKDSQRYIDKFYDAFANHHATHITIGEMEAKNVRDTVLAQDILYVGGGDTKFMLSVWRETGFIELLKEAYEKGIILAGISAGAMCWFEVCFDEGEEFEGVGLLPGTFCPHYNEEKVKEDFEHWLNSTSVEISYTATDPETYHFRDEKLLAVIKTMNN